MQSETLVHASKIWDYLAASNHCIVCDAIVVCCSYDLRVCDYACGLIDKGLANTIIFSGNLGHWTSQLWNQPEAEVFAARAADNGVNSSTILIEPRAGNLGENIEYSRALIPGATSVTFVSKPNTLLRIDLTIPVQWPDIKFVSAAPGIRFPEEVSNVVGIFGLISEMVGDIHRIIEYPKQGFQNSHTLPSNILESWKYLINQGFTWHLLPEDNLNARP